MGHELEIPSPFYRVSLKALVFDERERLLVVEEPGHTWEPPGGGWEHGETIEECLDRELREEVGVGLGTVDRSTMHASTGPGRRLRYRRLKLAVRATLERPDVVASGEVLATRWVTPRELSALAIPAGDEALRDHILAVWPGRG